MSYQCCLGRDWNVKLPECTPAVTRNGKREIRSTSWALTQRLKESSEVERNRKAEVSGPAQSRSHRFSYLCLKLSERISCGLGWPGFYHFVHKMGH